MEMESGHYGHPTPKDLGVPRTSNQPQCELLHRFLGSEVDIFHSFRTPKRTHPLDSLSYLSRTTVHRSLCTVPRSV